MNTEETNNLPAGSTDNNDAGSIPAKKETTNKIGNKTKAGGNKSVTKPQQKLSGKVGHDPKNREVTLTQKGEKFTVTKPSTGFTFTGTEKKAKEVYKHQLNCSHN
jgi:hypothetical protein